MFLEIIIAISIGVIIGIITGITPGAHLNLVAAITAASAGMLFTIISPTAVIVFIVAMAVTHTIIDVLPSTYLGAPSADMIANAVPAHKLLHEGFGHAAIVYTIVGCLSSAALGTLATPLLALIIPKLQELMQPVTGILILCILLTLLLWEKPDRMIPCFLLFMIAGIFGSITLSLPMQQPLLPLLSGMFGISGIIASWNERQTFPKQSNKQVDIPSPTLQTPVFAATLMGAMGAFLPGIGSAQMSVIATRIFAIKNQPSIIALTGGINTVSMIVSIVTLLTIDKARNGAIAAIQEMIASISWTQGIVCMLTAIIAVGISSLLTIIISRRWSSMLSHIPRQQLGSLVISTITVLTLFFDGILGASVLITSTAIGIITHKIGIPKHYLMGCLVLSVLLFFI